jgi:chemotaxis protein methyltransferase CheR
MALAADIADRLSPRDFEKLARFIHGYSGIKMPANKLTMLEGRLRHRLREGGFPSFAAYCRYLFDQNGLASESVALIDAVTTNKTDFFREPDHFRMLVDVMVPALLRGRAAGEGPLRVWSAASSTGAEAYTIAMVLADAATRIANLQAEVIATDICTDVLETAIAGIYPEAMIEPVPAVLRQRYLMRGKDRTRRLARIAPQIRAMVRFGRLNLMEAPYRVPRDLDVIFCRNILIYFDKPTQEAVLTQLCAHLRIGGYLILGHSESLAGVSLPVSPVGNTVFQRVGA